MIEYNHLLGREWYYGKDDCYGIIRAFYKDNFDIVLPNYARPNEFWEHGMNMYMDRFRKDGFVVLQCHPVEYQPGDLFLMSIQSSVANHAGILVENNQMLHHLVNQVSTVTPYKGLWRNNTIAVIRHKDVKDTRELQTVDIMSHVPSNIRRKINERLETVL